MCTCRAYFGCQLWYEQFRTWLLVTGGKGRCVKPAAGSVGLKGSLLVPLVVMVVVLAIVKNMDAGSVGS